MRAHTNATDRPLSGTPDAPACAVAVTRRTRTTEPFGVTGTTWVTEPTEVAEPIGVPEPIRVTAK